MKIGIDLGGSHIAIGVINDEYKIVEKIEKSLKTFNNKERLKDNIEHYLLESIDNFTKKYEIEKIGISVPGTICDGIIEKSVNLGIKNEPYNIKEVINKKFKIDVNVRNDANCAAIAENEVGILKKYKRVIFLTLGTGIGGSVIINGKILDTGKYPGCEFGHTIIETNGRECKCGKKGCFERYASMKVFKDTLREGLGLTENTHGEELLQILINNKEENSNYEVIDKIIDEFIKYLAIGISNLVNIFEPEAVGIGGSFVFFEEILLNRLKEEIANKQLLFNKRDLIIVPASLKNDAGIIGSVI